MYAIRSYYGVELGSDLHAGLFNACSVVIQLLGIAFLELFTDIRSYISYNFV